ncbi:mitochondrial carrier [Gonapodya prolifera JEL478]|uniref:Mitochondrial carrier n=1 Tax=Gonapodya prolifera (strain JEL478) TaxID=1344416 RepID=A0A139A440_GONPJ|nr:mitochondrial carrier [Gonapodya prolifera JEL478]|eukprot:KXS11358.1 mitochondrial carrier [Gonapodya prolifera JEL478]
MSDNVAHALAGAGGGIVSMALTYPLFTLSTRNQVSRDKTAGAGGQLAIAQKILKEEGLPGFYAGIDSAIFGIAITNGVYYYFYEAVKAAFEKAAVRAAGKARPMTALESMLAGAVAGAATATITNPIWVINTRASTKSTSGDDKAKSKGVFQAAMDILKNDGPKEFFRGLVPALILVINPIIQYTVFEQVKAKLEATRKLSNFDFFLLGAISKLAATSITYPYIVIKSRMQLRQGTDENSRYNSIADGFRKIIRTEGIIGLYKGIESKLLQSVLTAAFLFMAKEILFQYAVSILVLVGARKAKASVTA